MVTNQVVLAKVLEVDPIHHRIVVAIIDYPADGVPEEKIPLGQAVTPIPDDTDDDEDEDDDARDDA